jgi:hypothetical protein
MFLICKKHDFARDDPCFSMFRVLYVFKALNGLAHVYVKDPVTAYEPARTLHSENALLVVQLKVRTKTYGERLDCVDKKL